MPTRNPRAGKRKAARTSNVARPPAPVSLSKRWDKAKWHIEGDPPMTLKDACAHILAAFRFLRAKGMLTPSGTRELADGGSDELALLAAHVKPVGRAFLDAAYEDYLRALDPGPPKVALKKLELAWADFSRRYDLDARPRATPYQKLLAFAWEPTLDALLSEMRGRRVEMTALRSASAHAPARDRRRIEAFFEVSEAIANDIDGFAKAKASPEDLLFALAYVLHPRTLRSLVRLLARLPRARFDKGACDEAIAEVVNRAKREDWMKLPAGDRKRLRDAIHRLMPREPHISLCALRVAADATSLRLVEAAGTFPQEGTVETYRETKKGVELAKVARGYDDLRRAIARVVSVKKSASKPRGRARSR